MIYARTPFSRITLKNIDLKESKFDFDTLDDESVTYPESDIALDNVSTDLDIQRLVECSPRRSVRITVK